MQLSRRHFFFGSLALPAVAAKKPAPDRPNILLLLADNVPQWALSGYGTKEIRTPNLDRLARVGVRMMDHFSAAPAPDPGRASLVSGLAPMQQGESIDKTLAAAGYACAAANAAGAAGPIDAAAPGKPFFLTVALTSPKAPYDNVAEKYRQMYATAPFDTFNPEPVAGTDVIGSLRKYAGALTALDDEVQTVLGRLAQKKISNETLVIFTSTCGALLSHHGLWGAESMFEESVATPIILSWPMRLPPSTTRPEIVSSYDLAPTICDFLSLDKPAKLCGRSYALLAAGKPLPKGEKWQSAVFGRLGNTWMARGERYKLVLREGGLGELYDIQTDKAEKTNQFDNPQFVTVKNTLTNALNAWRQKYSA